MPSLPHPSRPYHGVRHGAHRSTESAPARKRVLLAKPRGYCAGVDRAVQTVEHALEHYGAPVYVRKQIVHNLHVVQSLEARGAIFVEENDEVPEGSIVVFSAHGVAPEVHEQAAARGLRAIDATCPLVTKVHHEARRFAKDDYDILLIGHEGHEEVVGTSGEAPEHITLVDGPRDVGSVQVRDPEKVVWLSQTTLSVDETMQTVDALRERFPLLAVAAVGRHLLRDAEPPGRGQADRARRSSCSSWWVRRTRRTRSAWSRWPPRPGAGAAYLVENASAIDEVVAGRRDVGRVCPPARRCRTSWSRTSSPGSPSAATPISRRSPTPRSG